MFMTHCTMCQPICSESHHCRSPPPQANTGATYPLVLLNNLRDLAEVFVVGPVHARKVLDGISDFQASLVCRAS